MIEGGNYKGTGVDALTEAGAFLFKGGIAHHTNLNDRTDMALADWLFYSSNEFSPSNIGFSDSQYIFVSPGLGLRPVMGGSDGLGEE